MYIFVVSKNRKRYHLALKGNDTLEDLFYKIDDVFDFEPMHLWAFFMDNKEWSDNAYYSPDSMDGPFADEIKISELGVLPKQKFRFLYDFGSSIGIAVYLKEKISLKEFEVNYLKSNKKTLRLV